MVASKRNKPSLELHNKSVIIKQEMVKGNPTEND